MRAVVLHWLNALMEIIKTYTNTGKYCFSPGLGAKDRGRGEREREPKESDTKPRQSAFNRLIERTRRISNGIWINSINAHYSLHNWWGQPGQCWTDQLLDVSSNAISPFFPGKARIQIDKQHNKNVSGKNNTRAGTVEKEAQIELSRWFNYQFKNPPHTHTHTLIGQWINGNQYKNPRLPPRAYSRNYHKRNAKCA